jgi:hypothetical protein
MIWLKCSLVGLLAYASYSLCDKVHFEISLTWGPGAPDGQLRDMIYINGQFPGPQLTLDYGDNVEVSGHDDPVIYRIQC